MSSNRPIEDLKQDTGVSHPTCTLARPFLRVLFRRQGSALASLRFWSTVANRDLAPTSDARIRHPMQAVVSSVSSVEQTGVLRQRRSDSPFTSDHSARASRVSPPLILWNTAQPSSVLSVTTSTSTSNYTSTLHVHSIFKSADTQTVAVLLVRVRKLACDASETNKAARQIAIKARAPQNFITATWTAAEESHRRIIVNRNGRIVAPVLKHSKTRHR